MIKLIKKLNWIAIAGVIFVLIPSIARAQSPAPSPSQSNEELRRRLEAVEKEVEALRQQLAQQASQSPPQAVTPIPVPTPRGEIPVEIQQDTFNRERETAARVDNAPIDPKLRGFFNIPGTRSRLKLDGYAKLDFMYDPRPAGNPDSFVTTSIPTGLADSEKVANSNVHARQTRFNLDFRSPTPLKNDAELRVFAEMDFFGTDGNTDPRLRHFYGQLLNVLAGHTWSTFTDPDTLPDTLDVEGPAGVISTRQAQIRYTAPFGHGHTFAISVERPNVQARTFADGKSYNPAPDFVARYRYEQKRWHIQVGSLYRVLGFRTPTRQENVFGIGANLSLQLSVFKRDSIILDGTGGKGIARYISNLGGQNLDEDLTNAGTDLRALPVYAFVTAYRHYWGEQWRSTFTYGYDRVQNTASQPLTVFAKSDYISGNLLFNPKGTNLNVGGELLYGAQWLRNNTQGNAFRVQFSIKYDLYRKDSPTP